MSKPKLAIFDYDTVIYRSAFAGETRTVEVEHIPSGRKMMFKNQTEFRGRGKKIGGWLGDLNETRIEKGQKPFELDEFSFEVVREVDELPNVLHTTKVVINKILEQVGAEQYLGYIGSGQGFRHEQSTLWEYKGNRKDILRPILKDDVAEYIHKHHNGIIEDYYEADDRVIMKALEYGVDNCVVISVDKDSAGCPVRVYNPNKPDEGIVDCRGFGELSIGGTPKNRKVEGKGRMFLYYQVASGDEVDNYKANCVSEKDWGSVSAYNALKDCQNDADAMMALKEVYQNLYPEPKEIIGWRGDSILVDWKYVIREIWNLARMRRSENDDVDVIEVMRSLGVV